MNLRYPFILLAFLVTSAAFAQPGDTTIIQTFTFEEQNNPLTAYDSPGRRWFQFPSSDQGTHYQKILMYHTLKCFEDGTAGGLGFPCGEWDYLSYNYLYKHTGMFDSTFTWHPRYLVNNQFVQTASLSTQAPVNTYQYTNTYLTIDQTNSESIGTIGAGAEAISGPWSNAPRARTQYLLTAAELTAAGLVAGDIHRIQVSQTEIAGLYEELQIDLRAVGTAALNNFDAGPFTTVFHSDVELSNTGTIIHFTTPFTWNGTSNLVVQLSYARHNDATSSFSMGDNTNYNACITSSGNDRYILFDGGDKVIVPPAAFDNISSEITISFWQYGTPEFQPEDGTTFEGVNSNNQRVLNTHLPWSNGRVYWDAGYNGGYNRIDKAATTAQYEGKWNHWAFTKNATTGVMRIYLNGVQWHTGGSLFNTMEDVVKFYIGAAAGWTNYYRGAVDDFAIFNVALDAATINAWKNRTLTTDHPFWNNLQVYYTFDEDNNSPILDHSPNGHHAQLSGNPSRVLFAPHDLFKDPVISTYRPQISFYQGDYVTSTVTSTSAYTLSPTPVVVEEYTIANYNPVLINSSSYYNSAWSYTYDPSGVAIDSTVVNADFQLINDSLWYYQAPVERLIRYELGRYITPYGIQLDMGEGWTWVYDVTDFAPLLLDSVELECGNWQELLDLKFVFIEGEPARDVTRIENVWNGNWNLNSFDQNVTAKTLTLEEGESEVKLRTTVTGHGFGNDNNNCGEFCYNTHSVRVNGTNQWQWEIMQDCDLNPLFPQGGTWIYARAGWCPGAPGTTKEFELTPFVQNNAVMVDYNIEYDPYGNYVTESQAVYYGAKNHSYDAEIDRILAPSDFLLNSRFNPNCDNAKFVLRNKGSEPLTSATIQYRVNNGATETYFWTGNLGFMESTEVEFSVSNSEMWIGGPLNTQRFYIDIVSIGNGVDENPSNNHAESTFKRPVIYSYLPGSDDDNRLIIIFKTNSAFQETRYTLYDRLGNVVFARNDFDAPNVTYRDTIQLNAGCYTFQLLDSEGDGLSFFANNDGNGTCRFDRVNGADFINFENDFGKEILHSFVWETNLVSVEENSAPLRTSVKVYPNPTAQNATVEVIGMDRVVTVEIIDLHGKTVYKETIERRMKNDAVPLSTSQLANGLYLIKVSDATQTGTTRLIKE